MQFITTWLYKGGGVVMISSLGLKMCHGAVELDRFVGQVI